MLDEVFGQENFLATIMWDKSRKNDAKLISAGHDYILIYARSKSRLRSDGVMWRESKPGTKEIWEKYLELRAAIGENDALVEQSLQEWFRSLPKDHPSRKWSRYKRVDKYGPWRDRDISWPGGGGPTYDVLHPVTKKPCKVPERGWIYADPAEMQRQINLGAVEFRETHEDPPFRKFHLKPRSYETFDDDFEDVEDAADDELATQVRTTYLYKQSQVSVKDLRDLMGAKIFTNPKDYQELNKLFEYVSGGKQDCLVMDFFAGSGSTGHALQVANASDGGRRRFILVQLPEPLSTTKKEQKSSAKFLESMGKPLNIAELTKERLRRAGAKIREEHPDATIDTGFRVYKLATSNLKPWQPDAGDLEASILDAVDNVLPGRTEEDLLVELLLKTGIDLTLPEEKRSIAGQTVHALGGGTLMVCLGNIGANDAEALGQGMADWVDELDPVQATVYFKDAGLGADGNRAATKANLAAILRQRLGDRIAKIASI
ncbi:DNA methyltransferase [Sphingobium yanoikuyae]|nr:DNA methyltransferase [Sphingobium yanoikuyae]